MPNKFREILKEFWGYDAFRDLQEDIIQSVYDGKDTLGLMPTGGGKSITFQVPALALEGTCLVITPLIALMKDQITNLRKKGIKAAAIYSGMTRNDILTTLENCIYGDYKFLYLSPERLETELFLSRIEHLRISFITVDEAHCISQWGYDFRPSYLNISKIRELKPGIPVLALTATATPNVVNDIQERLGFGTKNVFQKSFNRPNIAYRAQYTEDKLNNMVELLTRFPGTAIVYVRNRKKTKEISEFLVQNGISSSFYHAGLEGAEKDRRQKLWSDDNIRVIVSTNAFGMGIDKPNVRIVIHLDIPDSPEAYFQEAGRAGRDEKPAVAYLLYSKTDVANLKRSFTEAFPEKDYIRGVYDHLGNYFQLAIDDGLNKSYNFEIGEFCKSYKLSIVQAHNALGIVQKAGYLQLTDARDNSSQLHFRAAKEDLFDFQKNNPQYEELIKTILRSYSGLFSSYVYISESTVASRCGLTGDKVYEYLVALAKAGMVSYIPQKKAPTITYLQPRYRKEMISIPAMVYEDQRERMRERVNAMLYYLSSQTICRSRILLAYFGEKSGTNCNCCDVCLNAEKTDITALSKAIISILKEGSATIDELHKNLHTDKEKLIELIRFMSDNDEIIIENKLIKLNV
jgi:ATP-dependent DNA helicase RecQ